MDCVSSGAQYVGAAAADQAGAFGMGREAGLQGDLAQLVGSASGGSHVASQGVARPS